MKPNQITPNRLATLAAVATFILLAAFTPQNVQAQQQPYISVVNNCGQLGTYYQGDSVGGSGYTVYMNINQTSWSAMQVGVGYGTGGGSETWYGMSYISGPDGGGNDYVGGTISSTYQFTQVGNYYLIFQAKVGSGTYTTAGNCGGYVNTTAYPPSTMSIYFAVNSLNPPSSQAATAASSTSINLTWARGVSSVAKNTVIFRSTSATAPTLVQGTAYTNNQVVSGATCIYATASGTSFTDSTGLTAGTQYYYYFFAENYSYYSATVSASAIPRPTAVTWNGSGSDNNLQTDANWVGGVAPVSGISTFLTFAGSTRTNPYNNFPAGSTFSNVFFNGITVPFTLGGSNFNLQQKIENDNSSLVTITNSITWAASSGPTSGEINAVGGNLDFSTGTLTVNGSSIAGIKMWNAAGETNIFDGTVSASGKWFGLTQNPAGAATIRGSFTSGDFYVMNGGILNLSGSGSFSTTGLRLGGDYSTTGNQDQTKGGTFNLTSPTGGQTYAGIINSVAGNSSGSLVIYSANTSGTNIINGASYLDSGLIVSNAAGGTLLANASTAFDVKAQQLTLTPYGTILVQGILTSSTSSSTVPGGTLLMNGPGTLILSNTANAYSGTSGADLNANSTLITGGGILGIYGDGSLGVVPNGPYNNIQFTGSGTLQDTANSVSLNVNRSISVAAASTATLDSNTNTFAVPGIISGSGAVAKAGSGTLTLSGANTYTGATTISAGTLTIGGAGQLGSSGNYSAAITNNSAFNYNSSAAQTLSGIISGTGSLTENGAGALTLSGANTFTGNMTVKAGAVSVSNPTGLGVGTVVVGSTSGSANASLLAVGGNNTFTNLITVQSGNSGVLVIGNQSGANNSYVFSGNVSLNNALTLVAASTGTVKLSGNITGSSLITVTNDGALVSTSQYVDLTGANSGFTGNVAVNGGMLRLEGATALNSANSVQLNFTNTMLNLNTANLTLAGLAGVAGGIVTNTSGGGRTLTLAGAGQYAFNGAILDANTTATRISLTFAGAGTNIFGGTNTYSGATLITNGTLLVNGFNLGTNSVTVTNAGSTLGGTGVISGPVRFNAGTLAQFTLGAPMTISNSVTLATGGVIPQVKIAMSNNVPLGTYVLATFTSSTGVFSNTPVILAGGSLAANTVGSIVTTSTNVVLNVVMAIIPSTNTITSSNPALVYGGSVTFTATVQTNSPTGAASGANSNFIFAVDGVSVATNLVNGSSQATCTISTLTAGSHAIQAIYVGDATYSPSTNTYVQTVSQLPVMITGTRAYDGTALATNTILKITNSVGSDNVTNFLQTTAGYATLAGSGVGSQNIIATNHLTLNGGVGTNYTLVGASGSVVITAIPLTITASSTNKVYGQNLVFAGTEFTVVGLTNGDTVSSVTLTSSGATSTATVGSYGIVPSSAAGSGLANYSIAYSNGTLTVTQATPTNTLAASANPSGFQDTIVFTNTLNADATGYVLFSTNSVLWSSNNLSGGVAVSLSITNLPRGTNLITAAYSGDTNYVAGSISLNQIVTNHPPVANINTYGRGTFTTWQIAVSDLLTNASDVDGDTLSLVGVATSTNGITLVIDTNAPARVSYYNTNLVADQFTYTVADGFGGTNSAVITLTASGGGVTGTSSITSITGTSVKVLTAYGITGYTYVTQRATNVNQMTWLNLATNTLVSPAVIISVTDSNPPSPSAFYRLLWSGY